VGTNALISSHDVGMTRSESGAGCQYPHGSLNRMRFFQRCLHLTPPHLQRVLFCFGRAGPQGGWFSGISLGVPKMVCSNMFCEGRRYIGCNGGPLYRWLHTIACAVFAGIVRRLRLVKRRVPRSFVVHSEGFSLRRRHRDGYRYLLTSSWGLQLCASGDLGFKRSALG